MKFPEFKVKMCDKKNLIGSISQPNTLNSLLKSNQHRPVRFYLRKVFRQKRGTCHQCDRFKKNYSIIEKVVNKFDNNILVTGYYQYSFGISLSNHMYTGYVT